MCFVAASTGGIIMWGCSTGVRSGKERSGRYRDVHSEPFKVGCVVLVPVTNKNDHEEVECISTLIRRKEQQPNQEAKYHSTGPWVVGSTSVGRWLFLLEMRHKTKKTRTRWSPSQHLSYGHDIGQSWGIFSSAGGSWKQKVHTTGPHTDWRGENSSLPDSLTVYSEQQDKKTKVEKKAMYECLGLLQCL